MNNKSIEISTNLTTEDLKRIGFRQIRTKLIIAGSMLFIFFVFIGLGVLLSLLSKKNNIPLASFVPMLIPIGIFSFVILSFIWVVTKQAKQLGEKIEQTKYIFNEQGVQTESASAFVKTSWSNFLKIVESKTDFLLYTQKNIAIPIPKRFFTNENQITEFRNLIEEKLGKQAKLRK